MTNLDRELSGDSKHYKLHVVREVRNSLRGGRGGGIEHGISQWDYGIYSTNKKQNWGVSKFTPQKRKKSQVN